MLNGPSGLEKPIFMRSLGTTQIKLARITQSVYEEVRNRRVLMYLAQSQGPGLLQYSGSTFSVNDLLSPDSSPFCRTVVGSTR